MSRIASVTVHCRDQAMRAHYSKKSDCLYLFIGEAEIDLYGVPSKLRDAILKNSEPATCLGDPVEKAA